MNKHSVLVDRAISSQSRSFFGDHPGGLRGRLGGTANRNCTGQRQPSDYGLRLRLRSNTGGSDSQPGLLSEDLRKHER